MLLSSENFENTRERCLRGVRMRVRTAGREGSGTVVVWRCVGGSVELWEGRDSELLETASY